MRKYRLLLFDASARLHAGHWFHARDDAAAHWIARQLQDACSDLCPSFELWHGSQRIEYRPAPPDRPVTAEEASERLQQMLVFHEEVLRDSAFALEASQRLLARLRRIKTQRLLRGG